MIRDPLLFARMYMHLRLPSLLKSCGLRIVLGFWIEILSTGSEWLSRFSMTKKLVFYSVSVYLAKLLLD